jgi:hypothetical protein
VRGRILIVTEEVIMLAAPGSDVFLRDDLAHGLVAFLDGQFVNPAVAAVAGLHPGSITNGLTPIASSGSTAAAAVEDLKAVLAEYVSNGGKVETAVVLLSSQNAIGLRLTGNAAFDGLTRDGGIIGGLPAIASDALDDQIVVLDSAGVFLADDGAIDVNIARSASVEMLDNPTNSAASGTGTTMVSLWQNNAAGIRVERFMNWLTRQGAVAVLDGAHYLAPGSPA